MQAGCVTPGEPGSFVKGDEIIVVGGGFHPVCISVSPCSSECRSSDMSVKAINATSANGEQTLGLARCVCGLGRRLYGGLSLPSGVCRAAAFCIFASKLRPVPPSRKRPGGLTRRGRENLHLTQRESKGKQLASCRVEEGRCKI